MEILKYLENTYRVLNVFHDDVAASEDLLNVEDTPFHRRQYIRNLFSAYESSIWHYKQLCLQIAEKEDYVYLEPYELAFLRETDFKLQENGKFKEKTVKVSFKANVLGTVEVLNKVLETNIAIDSGSSEWREFMKAVGIRDVITHPKDLESFDISDEQLDTVKSSFRWFVETFHTPVIFSSLGNVHVIESKTVA
ncbi:hypothetical protein B7489_23075 [Vibrio alginolyticus]|uniref:hypothetical protein n=1 Tax=Vibrio alginolyticus TaxID=663 RepID=UPI000A1FBD67|nr:hypothetical protein [Vibrio alginolyticus]OSP09128.1 hypothetical protein B7489_23075 [Vibrio alginolyticus]